MTVELRSVAGRAVFPFAGHRTLAEVGRDDRRADAALNELFGPDWRDGLDAERTAAARDAVHRAVRVYGAVK